LNVHSIDLAVENGAKTIAFPSISTGAYGYPLEKVVKVVQGAARKMLENYSDDQLEKVYFVCFDDKTYQQNNDIKMGLSSGKVVSALF